MKHPNPPLSREELENSPGIDTNLPKADSYYIISHYQSLKDLLEKRRIG